MPVDLMTWAIGIFNGRLVAESPNGLYPERYGLQGNFAAEWPDLRVFVDPPPQYVFTPDGSMATIHFKIPWARQYDLVRYLLGYPYIDTTGVMKRHLPEALLNWQSAFPDSPNTIFRPLHCTKVGPVTGIGDGADTERFAFPVSTTDTIAYPDPGYEWARVPAHFETLLYDVKFRADIVESTGKPAEMQRYVIKTEHAGGSFLTQNYGAWELVLASGQRKPILNQNVNFWEAFNTIRYEWLDVLPQAVNWDRVQLLNGKTNDREFDGHPAGTLAMLRPNRIPKMTPLGIRTYRIIYEILQVPTGVNKAKGPGPGDGYGDIVKRGGNVGNVLDRPFQADNFDNLFKP
jgi:hypothetical protein